MNRTGTPAIELCVCNPGFENLVEGVCHQCPAGTFRTHRTAVVEKGVPTTCLLCPAHAYCPLGSVQPILCPLDEISAPGSASQSDCKCAAGRGRSVDGACEFCAHGFFAPGNTNLACEQCPRNTNTSTPGATSIPNCTCTPGHGLAQADHLACEPCETGFFAVGGDNIACIHCGFGTVTQPPERATGWKYRLAKFYIDNPRNPQCINDDSADTQTPVYLGDDQQLLRDVDYDKCSDFLVNEC